MAAVLDGERFFVPLRRLRKTRRHRFAMATSTTTISRRINTGFVALIGLCAALGLFATYQMRSAATGARFLAAAVAPQAGVAADISEASAATQLAARTYGLTGDPALYAAATQHLAKASAAIEAGRKLSETHPELTALRDGVKSADDDLKIYQAHFAATKDNLTELAQIRKQLDASAAAFLEQSEAYVASQNKTLTAEITAGAAKEKLEERREKIELGNAIVDAGNAVRIATFKAQALRDPTLLEQALAHFAEMDGLIKKILSNTRQEVNLRQLANVKKSADAYRSGIDALVRNYAQNADLALKRSQVADEFDHVVHNVLTRSIARTLEYSTVAAADLTAASFKTVAGLVLTIVICVVASILIVRGINRASQSLAEGSSEQAASLEEISSSLEELSSMTKHNAANAGSAKISADQTRSAAEQGAADMEEMKKAMDAIASPPPTSRRSSRPSTKSPFRPTSSPSTPPSKPPAPARPAWVSPSSPKKSATSPNAPPPPPRKPPPRSKTPSPRAPTASRSAPRSPPPSPRSSPKPAKSTPSSPRSPPPPTSRPRASNK
jgi:methyl-accepting chemotaxis protein